jgi:C4-dicarboxylate transporter, DctM subunit
MIPPSINLIVYGFLTETSIPRLFLAGLIPGLLLALLFMAISAGICWARPGYGGPTRSASWSDRIRGLRDLLPLVALFAVVIGSIYRGWATPTEAAAIGVAAAALIAAANRGLTIRVLVDSLLGTVRTTAMVMFVIVGAYFLNFTLASAGLGRELTALLDNLGLGPYETLLVVILLYIVLGFFIETMALMIATIPIVVPVVVGLGFDPIWFGILVIVLIEMALITPPVGLNLYVVQAARARGRFSDVMIGALPYVFGMLLMIVALILFPQLALYLPSL